MPNFAGFFREKPDSGSGKSDTRSRNLFVLKHIWVKVSISWEFQPNRSNNTLKTGFFRISGKSGSRIRNFFGLKPSRDQDGANKKKFSQIGPAVPELLRDRQTDTQTDKTPYYFWVLSVVLKYFNLHGHYAALRPPPLVHTNFSLLSKLWNILEKYSFDIKHLLIRLFYF